MVIKKVHILLIIFLFLLLITIALSTIVLHPILFPAITFTNTSEHKIIYQRSQQFESYLDTWQIVNSRISINLFHPKNKFIADKLEIVLVAKPPSDPTYQLIDESTTPPTIISSVKNSLTDRTLTLTIYQNQTKLLQSYEKNITWLIIYSLYKRVNPYLKEETIISNLNPVYNELTSNSANSLLITHE